MKSVHKLFILVLLGTVGIVYYLCTDHQNISNEKEVKYLQPIDLINNISTAKLYHLKLSLLNEPEKCTSNLLAVMIVTSYIGHVELRSSMRRSISNQELLRKYNVRRVFLLGEHNGDKYINQKLIDIEAQKFGDIIQGNFVEAYRNLTYKHLMGLKWAAEECAVAKYIIKMDDDIVINHDKIFNILQFIKLPANLIAGYILKGMKPIRLEANKWYVTQKEYTGLIYPTFVSGWLYITNPTTALKLVGLSKFEPYFWIDDVLITGILAKHLNIKHYNFGTRYTVHPEFLKCCLHDVVKYKYDCEVLVGPNGGENNLYYDFNKMMSLCSTEGTCKKRHKSLNDTCVAERKYGFLERGDSIIETVKL